MNVQEAAVHLRETYVISIGDDDRKHADYIVQDLIDDSRKASEMLKRQSHQMHNSAKVVTGTLFGKRYSVLCMGFLDALVQYRILLDLDPRQVGIRHGHDGEMGYLLPSAAMINVSELSQAQVEKYFSRFVHCHLVPLFQTISNLYGSKMSHMLSLVSHNFHQVARRLKQQFPDRGEDIDFYLRKLISPSLTSEDSSPNPLAMEFRLYEPADGDDPFYIRKHCCLAYMNYGGDKSQCCSTCPLIPDENRC